MCICWLYFLSRSIHSVHGYGNIKFILLTLRYQFNFYIDLPSSGISYFTNFSTYEMDFNIITRTDPLTYFLTYFICSVH